MKEDVVIPGVITGIRYVQELCQNVCNQIFARALEQMDFTKLLHYLEETGQGKLFAGKNPSILKVSRKLKRTAVLGYNNLTGELSDDGKSN